MFKYLPQICYDPDPPPPAPPAPPAPPTPTAWHEGMDAELIGHAQTHGWAALDATAAAKALAKAHLEAKKMIGVPADQLIRIPKDLTNKADMAQVYERLGAPKEAKDYDFKEVKRANGAELDAGLALALRNVAFEHRLPKSAALEMAKAFVGSLDAAEAKQLGEKTAALAEQRERLKQNWQGNPEVNMLMARTAANKLGVSEVEVEALQNVIGYDRVMEMFRTIGERTGEHSYLMPKGPGGKPQAMTREQAIARKAELMGDADWGKRYTAGGVDEKAEMAALIRIIAG